MTESHPGANARAKGRFGFVALIAAVLAIAVVLAACVQQDTASKSVAQNAESVEVEGEVYEAGTVLVSLKEGLDAQESLETLEQETGIAGLSVASEGDGYVKLALPAGVTVEQAVEAFGQSSVIESAQPNFRYYLMDSVEDAGDAADAAGAATATAAETAFTSVAASTSQLQAGALDGALTQSVEIDDTYASNLWGLESVHAYEAWEIARCEGEVTVAIIDNVFRADHEDLVDNVVVAYNAVTQKEDDDVAGSSYTKSDKNHGTHVAGIIAAQAGNGIGVAGVSYNANLMLFRTATDDGQFYTDTLLNAYSYMIDRRDEYNVRVVNMSLGGYMEDDSWRSDADDLLLRAFDNAWDAGIVTVTSAGNAGYYVVNSSKKYISAPFSCYPSDYSRCVNVMNLYNTTSGDPFAVARSSSSNYNLEGRTNKDIGAPGSSIYSTTNTSASSYGYSSGTSMAAPCVSGIMALMFACRPDLTPAQAVRTLYDTATDLGDEGFDEVYGYGEVNALAALQACIEEDYDVGEADEPNEDYNGESLDITVASADASAGKLANTLTVHAKILKVRASVLKAKKKTFARKKAFVISGAKGTLTFTKVAGSTRLKIGEKGRITVKKNTKRGTYRMKVKVHAAGTDRYDPADVVVRVKVRVR